MTRPSFRAPGAIGRAAFLLLGLALACGPRDEPGATPVVAAATPPAAGDTGRAVLERADAARILGADSARVWLVEISDFQCPYCKRWHDETWPVIRREYVESGRVRFAYLNLPLPSHAHAREAAETALCAGLQGRYWQMHDAPALRACVRDGRTRPLVEADYERAVGAGVRSTPTFIAGGRLIEGAAPPEYFRAALDSALAASR